MNNLYISLFLQFLCFVNIFIGYKLIYKKNFIICYFFTFHCILNAILLGYCNQTRSQLNLDTQIILPFFQVLFFSQFSSILYVTLLGTQYNSSYINLLCIPTLSDLPPIIWQVYSYLYLMQFVIPNNIMQLILDEEFIIVL